MDNVAVSRKSRLSRQDWLSLAMEVLARKGGARINIDYLCDALGVTKGSFYGHFGGRADFVDQLIEYWDKQFTQVVVQHLQTRRAKTPEDRLLVLMKFIAKHRLARYDDAVRSWAAQDENVAKPVSRVYRKRFRIVRSLFQDMGFHGTELNMRTRMFVIYHSSDQTAVYPVGDSASELASRHAFFTQP